MLRKREMIRTVILGSKQLEVWKLSIMKVNSNGLERYVYCLCARSQELESEKRKCSELQAERAELEDGSSWEKDGVSWPATSPVRRRFFGLG